MTPERKKIIEELTRIMEERSATHGGAVLNFSNLSCVWNWWLQGRRVTNSMSLITPEDAAVMCALAKMARMLSPEGISNADNWIDAAGYAICGAEVAAVRKAANEAEKA